MPRRRVHRSGGLPELVVSRLEQTADFLEHIRTSSLIALDTEFVGEETYRPELCLIQVATRERLYLVDAPAVGSLTPFWELLLDPTRTIIVHAGREELRICRFAVGRTPASVFDVQIASGLVGMTYPIGYAALVSEMLGIKAHKSETLTDWRRRPLSPAQIKYAFDDVRWLIAIYDRLVEILGHLGRLGWAGEEFAAFVKRATSDEPAVEKWRKIKGIGVLSRRESAAARELFAWRESFAARVNRPPRTLLRDDLIIEIARRGVSDDLHSLRGVPRGELPEIIAAVKRAAALRSDELPALMDRDQDPPHVALLTNLLTVALNEFAARHRIAPNLIAVTQDLKSLIRSVQSVKTVPAERSALDSGWRASFVRPYLAAILNGEKVLRVGDPSSATPITVEETHPQEQLQTAASRSALLLIAHGSRVPEANADLVHLADEVIRRGNFDLVQVSYLEFAEPNILDGGTSLVERGAKKVILLPYFLSPGVHAGKDMREACEALESKFPDVEFLLAEPLGRHPLLVNLVELRASAAETEDILRSPHDGANREVSEDSAESVEEKTENSTI